MAQEAAAPRVRGSSKPQASHPEHPEQDLDGHSYHIVVTQGPEGHGERGDDGGDGHMYDPRGRSDAIRQSFLTKTLDVPVQSASAPSLRSPTHSEAAATSVVTGSAVLPAGSAVLPPRASRKRSKKKRHKDIFRAFGREHDMHAMIEVEVGGVVRQRTNYARCWENEEDLGRWHEALNSSSRHGRLLWDVKSKWHEDIATDTLELKERHNGFFRGNSPKAHPNDPAHQLRDLQRRLSPKERKKKKDSAKYEMLYGFAGIRGQNEGGNLAPMRNAPGGFEDQAQGLEQIASQRSPSKASSDVRSDIRSLRANSNSKLDAVSEGANTSVQGSRPGSRRPSDTSCGTAAERIAETLGTEPPDTDRSDITRRDFYGSRSRMPNMPKTMRFLLFRNADKLHVGTTAFLKKWPPANMAELLVACGHVSHPVVPPAEALYDADMRLVRSPDEVIPGCVYLLKGKEPLDPSHHFFQSASLSLYGFYDEEGASPAHAGSQRLQGVSAASFGSRIPAVGSPPSPAELALSDAYRGLGSKAWGVDRRLGMILSWGGLSSPPHRHHDFRSWPSALAMSGRGSLASLGGSLASTGAGSASAPQLMRMTQ